MVEFKQDIKEINRNLKENINQIKLQNEKIDDIDEKLKKIDEKTKTTNKYLKGFSSFFGFLPAIFNWGNKKEQITKKPKETVIEKESNNNIHEDDIENEIETLNENAKKLRKEIVSSLKASDILENQVEKSSSKVNRLLESAKKVYK